MRIGPVEVLLRFRAPLTRCFALITKAHIVFVVLEVGVEPT